MLLEIVYLWNIFFLMLVYTQFFFDRPGFDAALRRRFGLGMALTVFAALPVLGVALDMAGLRDNPTPLLEGIYFAAVGVFGYLSYTLTPLVAKTAVRVLMGAAALGCALELMPFDPFVAPLQRYGVDGALFAAVIGGGAAIRYFYGRGRTHAEPLDASHETNTKG